LKVASTEYREKLLIAKVAKNGREDRKKNSSKLPVLSFEFPKKVFNAEIAEKGRRGRGENRS